MALVHNLARSVDGFKTKKIRFWRMEDASTKRSFEPKAAGHNRCNSLTTREAAATRNSGLKSILSRARRRGERKHHLQQLLPARGRRQVRVDLVVDEHVAVQPIPALLVLRQDILGGEQRPQRLRSLVKLRVDFGRFRHDALKPGAQVVLANHEAQRRGRIRQAGEQQPSGRSFGTKAPGWASSPARLSRFEPGTCPRNGILIISSGRVETAASANVHQPTSHAVFVARKRRISCKGHPLCEDK